MDHNFNRTPSKEEKDKLTKDLIRNERRHHISTTGTLGAASGALLWHGYGKGLSKTLHDRKVKRSEQAINTTRKELHKPLKEIINKYRTDREYHRGNKPVVTTFAEPKPGLKAITGRPGAGAPPQYTLINKKKPEDFDRFVKAVKKAKKATVKPKMDSMKYILNDAKKNARGYTNIADVIGKARGKVYGTIGAVMTPVAGYAAYKYHQAAQKKLNESILRSGKYYYKDKRDNTYKVHQRNPAIAGATSAGLVGGAGVAAREGIKYAAKKSYQTASLSSHLLRPLSPKNIAIAAAAAGTVSVGKHLHKNIQNKKYLPMYLGGMKKIDEKGYKKNKTINPIDVRTPGSTIHERLSKPLNKPLEDKLPWGFNKMVIEPAIARRKKEKK